MRSQCRDSLRLRVNWNAAIRKVSEISLIQASFGWTAANSQSSELSQLRSIFSDRHHDINVSSYIIASFAYWVKFQKFVDVDHQWICWSDSSNSQICKSSDCRRCHSNFAAGEFRTLLQFNFIASFAGDSSETYSPGLHLRILASAHCCCLLERSQRYS